MSFDTSQIVCFEIETLSQREIGVGACVSSKKERKSEGARVRERE
jgi:hypothetical protein